MPQRHRGFPEFHAALQASSLLVARARPAMRFRTVLPEKLGRGRRVCGGAIKETKIGYLLGRGMHADGLPLYQDSEQDCDRSALRPSIDLTVFARSATQTGFFSPLPF